MRVWNADGSEPEMCGNGIRCVCKLAHDRGLSRRNPMRIQTGRGVLDLRWTPGADGSVATVTVGMGAPAADPAGRPAFEWPDVPMASDWRRKSGLEPELIRVSMGNPHAVFFCRDVDAVPLAMVGPVVETHPAFPQRTNVHFVQVLGPGEAKVRTWERGSGITLACGTGASAVCVAGVLTGRTARRLRAHLPGGDLDLDWSETDGQVRMTGPAVLVYEGEWPD
jgi:diaminopimelate epimerase